MGYTLGKVDRPLLDGFTLSSFEAILFDLDSTLTDTQSYPIKASEWFLAKSTDNPEEMLAPYVMELVRNYRFELKHVAETGVYKTPFDVVKDATRTTVQNLEMFVSEELLDEATQHMKKLHRSLSQMMPGADLLVKSLNSNNIRLGLITNTFEDHAEEILKELHLYRYFQVIVEGKDVEVYKPHRAPFEFALAKLGATPESSAMIGDEYFNDMVGAKRIGMHTVWINTRDHVLKEMLAKYGAETEPDLIVTSILELNSYL